MLQIGRSRVVIINDGEELPRKLDVVNVVGLLLVRVLVCAHPVLDLAEQDVLGARVAKQVVKFD